MPKQSDGKIIVIVEETVQRVFLFDPTQANMQGVVGTLQGIVLGEGVEHQRLFFGRAENRPPAILGRYAKKGPPTALLLEAYTEVENWKRFSGLRVLYPGEDGEPALEHRFTNSTCESRPINKGRK